WGEGRQGGGGGGWGVGVGGWVVEQGGGTLALEDTIGGGRGVALCLPGTSDADGRNEPSELARRILALLVELDPADAVRLAAELDAHIGEGGRELVLLEHRGLVARAPDGAGSLTPDGPRLVAALF